MRTSIFKPKPAPSTLDVVMSQQAREAEEIGNHLRGVAENIGSIGRLWFSQGLRAAQSTLDVAEDTLRDTAKTLEELRHDLDR